MKGIFNALNKVLCLASAMAWADGNTVYCNALAVMNKIVFTSPEVVVEFSGEKIKPRRSSKPFERFQIYTCVKGQL